jgi:hypothetical protein
LLKQAPSLNGARPLSPILRGHAISRELTFVVGRWLRRFVAVLHVGRCLGILDDI